jgi:hypothetical protein
MREKIIWYSSERLQDNGDFIRVEKLILEKSGSCSCLKNKLKSNDFVGKFTQTIVFVIYSYINQLFI